MDILKAFSLINENHHINIQGTVDNPLFQANQIGKILGILNIRESIKDYDEDERSVSLTDTAFGIKETNFLTEIGLYKLLGRSRKPIASIFQKWMINTIKEIRVNGMYNLKQENEVDKNLMVIKNELKTHSVYLDAYDNKKVVYVCKLKNVDDKMMIKIGKSEHLTKRMRQILDTYNDVTPTLINVFESTDFSTFEAHIHKDNFIKKYKFNEKTKHDGDSREIYLVNKEEYSEIIKNIKIIKKNYDNNELQILEKQIQLEDKKIERIRLQTPITEIELKQKEFKLKEKELELEIKKLEQDIAHNKEDIVVEDEIDEDHADEVSDEEPGLFTIKKRNPGSRIPKVYQYHPDNLEVPIKMYNGQAEVEREIPSCSPSPLKKASQNNTIYKGFRWLFVNRADEPPAKLEPTKITKRMSPEIHFIAMIDIKQTKILAVYSNQKEAIEARNMKCNSFTRAIQQETISSGHYWNFFDKCPEEMQTEFLSHSKLPEKYVRATCKQVQQIDPKTNEVIKTYSSNRDVCTSAQISNGTLKRITETDEIYNGYKWKVCM